MSLKTFSSFPVRPSSFDFFFSVKLSEVKKQVSAYVSLAPALFFLWPLPCLFHIVFIGRGGEEEPRLPDICGVTRISMLDQSVGPSSLASCFQWWPVPNTSETSVRICSKQRCASLFTVTKYNSESQSALDSRKSPCSFLPSCFSYYGGAFIHKHFTNHIVIIFIAVPPRCHIQDWGPFLLSAFFIYTVHSPRNAYNLDLGRIPLPSTLSMRSLAWAGENFSGLPKWIFLVLVLGSKSFFLPHEAALWDCSFPPPWQTGCGFRQEVNVCLGSGSVLRGLNGHFNGWIDLFPLAVVVHWVFSPGLYESFSFCALY